MPNQPQASPNPTSRPVALARFAVRALRVTASTVAVVALLRQQWLAGGCFALAWLLILGAPRLFPDLAEQSTQPDRSD